MREGLLFGLWHRKLPEFPMPQIPGMMGICVEGRCQLNADHAGCKKVVKPHMSEKMQVLKANQKRKRWENAERLWMGK